MGFLHEKQGFSIPVSVDEQGEGSEGGRVLAVVVVQGGKEEDQH